MSFILFVKIIYITKINKMADAIIQVTKCLLKSKTDEELDKCMNDFKYNIFESLSKSEQTQLQEIMIDTADSIDLVAYKNKTFYLILICAILASFIIVLILYCICICGNCCGMRTRKKKVYVPQQVNNSYLLAPN